MICLLSFISHFTVNNIIEVFRSLLTKQLLVFDTNTLIGDGLIKNVSILEVNSKIAGSLIQLEENQLINVLVKERSGSVESELRTASPVSAQVVAVDVGNTLLPVGRIEEGITELALSIEGREVETRTLGLLGLDELQLFDVLVVHGELVLDEVEDLVSVDEDTTEDTLGVGHRATVVKTTLVLNENGELVTGLTGDLDGSVGFGTLEKTDELAVEVDEGSVAEGLDGEVTALGEGSLVEDETVVDIEALEGHGLLALSGFGIELVEGVPEGDGLGHGDGTVGDLGVVLDVEVGVGESGSEVVGNLLVLEGHINGLGEGSIVIVGGRIGLVGVTAAVGTVEEVEVGTAEEDVEVDGGVHVDHLVEGLDDGLNTSSAVTLTPVIEPAGVVLGVEVGAGLLVLSLESKRSSSVTRTEIDSGVDLIDSTAGNHAIGRTISGEGDDLVTEVLLGLLEEVADVVVVADGVGTVLILDLREDDGTTIDVEVGDETREELIEPGVDVLDVLLIGRTDLDAVLLKNPVGEATELPLGANVGAGTKNGGHVVLLDDGEEALDIGNTLEIELTLLRLVKVPGDVGLDGVETSVGGLHDGVLPILGLDTEIVNGSRNHLVGLAILQPLGLTKFEGALSRGKKNKSSEKEANELHFEQKKK